VRRGGRGTSKTLIHGCFREKKELAGREKTVVKEKRKQIEKGGDLSPRTCWRRGCSQKKNLLGVERYKA